MRKRSFAQIVLDKTVSTPHSAKSGASNAPFHIGMDEKPEAAQTRAGRFNKGEARNALARTVFFNSQEEMRDRSFENQRYRASGLPQDPRTMSSTGSMMRRDWCEATRSERPSCAKSRSAAMRPMASTGCRTVVMPGRRRSAVSKSSNPTSAILSGGYMPRSCKQWSTCRVIRLFAQNRAVGGVLLRNKPLTACRALSIVSVRCRIVGWSRASCIAEQKPRSLICMV